jgi:hypothetical protein
MKLRENSRKIFEFKGLIWKIFRNKELAGENRVWRGEVLPLWLLSDVKELVGRGRGTPKEKGAGVIRALFLFYSSIISIRAGGPDKFSNFIFPASSLGCRENRQNRGLTEFSKIEKRISRLHGL